MRNGCGDGCGTEELAVAYLGRRGVENELHLRALRMLNKLSSLFFRHFLKVASEVAVESFFGIV